MTRRHILYTVLTAMAISAVIVIVSLAVTLKDQRAEAYRRYYESAATEAPTEICYTLKEYEDKLAVFRGESNTPYKILDVQAALLSDYDRKMLKDGITVGSENELRKLIEDFTS